MYALIAQLDRVSDYESEGRGFESLSARQWKQLPFRVTAFIFLGAQRDSNPVRATAVKQKAPGERFVGGWCADGHHEYLEWSSSRAGEACCPFHILLNLYKLYWCLSGGQKAFSWRRRWRRSRRMRRQITYKTNVIRIYTNTSSTAHAVPLLLLEKAKTNTNLH